MADDRQKMGGCAIFGFIALGMVGMLFLLVILVGVISGPAGPSGGASGSSVSISKTTAYEPPVEATYDVPKGFEYSFDVTDLRGQRVVAVFKWLKPSEYSCGYGDACWAIEVIPLKDCENMYAELVLLDKSQTNVGMTNDTTGAVAARSKARFVFQTYEETASTARIGEIKCY